MNKEIKALLFLIAFESFLNDATDEENNFEVTPPTNDSSNN